MQKYWKATTIVMVIIAAITVFYIQSAKMSDSFPHFSFKQTEGDVQAAETIAIEGNLQHAMGDMESFKITAEDGTSYLKDESFFKRLQGFYNSEKYEQRTEEHRSFMRGKMDQDMYYDENEHHLAYAEVHYGGITDKATLTIDVLDKDSGERIQMDTPLDSGDRHLMIGAVKRADNQLYIIMDGNNGEGAEVKKYTVDLKSEQISDKEDLYTADEDELDSYSSINYLFNEDHPDEEMMILEEQIDYDQTGGVETAETSVRHAAVYDLETNKAKDIDIPEDSGTPVAYNDSAIYLSEIDGKELKLASFDREQEKVTEELPVAIEAPPEKEAEADTQYVFRDGKLYIAVNYYGAEVVYPQVMVVDLSSFELVYKGKVVPDKNVLNEEEEQHINFGEMEVMTNDAS